MRPPSSPWARASRRSAGGALAGATLALLALTARADEARTLAALPEIPPTRSYARPARVAPSEQVPGLWVSAPRWLRGKSSGKASVVIVATAPVAISAHVPVSGAFGLKVGSEVLGSDVCLEASQDGVSWTPASTTAMVLQGERRDVEVVPLDTTRLTVSEDVWFVRAARLVEGPGDAAALERVDAWIDLRSGGAREQARSTVPLALVRRLPGGIAVYAAREGERASFVVRAPKRPPPASNDAPAASLTLTSGEGQPGHCGYRTVSLSVGRGQAASDFVTGNVVVPIDDDGGESAAPSAALVRPFRVLMTGSWLSREASPALGASFGWTAEARREPDNGTGRQNKLRR